MQLKKAHFLTCYPRKIINKSVSFSILLSISQSVYTMNKLRTNIYASIRTPERSEHPDFIIIIADFSLKETK